MKIKIDGKFLVSIFLMLVIIFLLCGNVIMQSRAQVAPTAQGFWFWRNPKLPQSMIDAQRKDTERYITRLQTLASIPIGTIGMQDSAANNIVWDQAMVDALNVEIADMQQLLDDLPE